MRCARVLLDWPGALALSSKGLSSRPLNRRNISHEIVDLFRVPVPPSDVTRSGKLPTFAERQQPIFKLDSGESPKRIYLS